MSNWVIYFAGHRNKITNNAGLLEVYLAFKDVRPKWVHGGVGSFCEQVQRFIEYHEIPHEILDTRPPTCHLLVVCYDGRRHGDTFTTIEWARHMGWPIKNLKVYNTNRGRTRVI